MSQKSTSNKDLFEEVKDEPEFKEFLKLQRNIGDKLKAKQIWSDDFDHLDVPTNAPLEVPTNAPLEESNNISNDIKPRKKHKRSRPKKKSTKAKPKELFEHTLKLQGFTGAKRKDIKNFFKPLELLSIRINRQGEICYVSFKDKSDMYFALRKDMHFWNTNRIKMLHHDVKKSRIFKEKVQEKRKAKEELMKKYDASLAETDPVEESGRLFIRNLSYTCTHDDLEQVFAKYGELTEVHFPIDKTTSMPRGYAYVEYMFPQNALQAYQELNGTIFQGRKFHLIPSKPKPEPKVDATRFDPNLSSYKRDKLLEQRKAVPKGTDWNILFLGQNSLADVVSNMKGINKSKLLTQQSNKEPIAVRMALGDATVVEEMRKFLISNGVELDSFNNPQAPRSKTVMIVKNLPASTEKSELQEVFEKYGRVACIILPPNGLTAIVEMEEAVDAKLAFRRLAYSKFKDTILYLEWAPINVFRQKSLDEQEQNDVKQLENIQTGTKILVKNIPFEATENELKKVFAEYGELNFVRIPKKMYGQHRGFGFVDYLTKEDALRAFRGLCHSTHLYGRKLVLEWAKVDETTKSSSTTNDTTNTDTNDNMKT